MEPEEAAGAWRQKAIAIVGSAVVVVFLVGMGIATFLTAMRTPLHTNPADVPSVGPVAPAPEWADAVGRGRQIARGDLVAQNLPGLSVAVGMGGELVWAEAFGWADIDRRVPLAPNMRFRIGHVSKSLTSAAVGLLVDQGLLDLDEPIQTYVPAFPEKQWAVTLRHLMGHASGLRHYEEEADYMPTTHCARAAEGLSRFADDPLLFQPETRSSYSTFGWILVSAAVEAVANEPFFTFMRKEILEPLGMRDTTTDSAAESIPNLATLYYPRLSGDPAYGFEPASLVDYSCFAGAGAFLSTPSDLVRFGMAMTGGTLLKPATVDMLQTAQRTLSGEETEHGLGWTVGMFPLDGRPARLASHASRTLLGGSAWLMTFPERGVVVAVASNTSLASMRQTALGIAQAFAERGKKAGGPAIP